MQRPNRAGRRVPLVTKKLLISLSCVGGCGTGGLSLCGKKRGGQAGGHSREVNQIADSFLLLFLHCLLTQALSTHTQDTHLHNHLTDKQQKQQRGLAWPTPASWNGPR